MSKYNIARSIKFENGNLIGVIEETGEIKLEGFDGPQGNFVNITTQYFDKEGTKNLPKYVEQSEKNTQEQLAKIKADLARIGPMKEDAVKKKQTQEIIALWRQTIAKPEMKRLQDKVADKINALNADLTKQQQYEMLKPQEAQLLEQLKRIKEDQALIEAAKKDVGNRNSN